MRTEALWIVAVAVIGCGSDDTVFSDAGAGGAGAGSGSANGGSAVGGSSDGGSAAGAGGAGPGSGGGGQGAGGSIVCPDDAMVPGEHAMTIMFDGNERQYDLQVPLSYDNTTALPLVLDLHGFTSTASQQELISGFKALAEEESFFVARPEGFGVAQSWNGGDFCCGAAQSQNLDDVGLMRAIVAEISTRACVDPKRVYASGLSNGGAMSHRLACDAADVFAAVAPVSYPLDFDPFDGCTPSRPIAVMHSHGTNDLIVPYNGGLTSVPVNDSFAYWATTNGCDESPTETYSSGNSSCATYQLCSAGVEVSLCTIAGGHVLYSNSDQVPVGRLSWDFLRRFTLP